MMTARTLTAALIGGYGQDRIGGDLLKLSLLPSGFDVARFHGMISWSDPAIGQQIHIVHSEEAMVLFYGDDLGGYATFNPAIVTTRDLSVFELVGDVLSEGFI
ncbi:MAG TPA: hypothetical protein VF867_11930 [Arthrobacter sp.]